MTLTLSTFGLRARDYLDRLNSCFSGVILDQIETMAHDLRAAWLEGRQVYICGNGGSAANAMHMANDFHYGIGACGPGPKLPGLRVEALPANAGLITCLANDTGYANIYSHQIEVKGRPDDLLIVLSGSGNSANVVSALETSRRMGLRSYAILAFGGGKCLDLADVPIHFQIDDMQIAEDTQLVVGHLCMQWLNTNKPEQI
jgi:D-sedoheptulose 7-phosphate isomerase